VADQIVSEGVSDRVAHAVRRALLLVGPAENGVERVGGEQPVEEPAV
jgi:hypothetical protein